MKTTDGKGTSGTGGTAGTLKTKVALRPGARVPSLPPRRVLPTIGIKVKTEDYDPEECKFNVALFIWHPTTWGAYSS